MELIEAREIPSAQDNLISTDEELVLRLQRGDHNAMSVLYSRYQGLVYNRCRSFFRNEDDALDVTQDIMLRVVEKISSFKGQSKFSTWLYSITFNYCTDRKRKVKNFTFLKLDELSDLQDCSFDELSNALTKERSFEMANSALSSISSEDRQLLLMKYASNKSIRDLEIFFNLSPSAVKMRLLRAKEKACQAYTSASLAA